MFCAYCGIDHDEVTPLSSEHIVPFAMGGSNELTILVCEASNNTLGGQIDRPVIEFFPVRSERFFFGLRGTDGTPPTFDLGGVTYLGGHEVQLKNVIGPSGKDMRLTGRIIEKTLIEDGERWKLSGSPEAIRKALTGKIEDQASKGKWVKNGKGEIVTIKNLDQMLAEATVSIQHPCVHREIQFDHLWTWRFFAKLSLATGHYLFGEEFSRSNRAQQLRKTMRAQTFHEAGLMGVAIFPETHSLPPQFALFKTMGLHTIVVCHGRPRLLMISLFGWLDACIALDDVEASWRTLPGEMQIMQITLPDRQLFKYSLHDYLHMRAARQRTENPRSPDGSTE